MSPCVHLETRSLHNENEFLIIDFRKNPRVRKILVRNSGAGNGCANFMDTWKNAFFLQENLNVHKIPRFGGGGGNFGFGGGGGSADFIFMGAGIFLRFCSCRTLVSSGPEAGQWLCGSSEKFYLSEARFTHAFAVSSSIQSSWWRNVPDLLFLAFCLKRWFWETVVLPLPKTGDFDKNGENDEFAFYAQKRRFSSSEPRKRRK